MNILIKNCLIIDKNSNHNNKKKDILIINGRFEKNLVKLIYQITKM